MGLLLYHSSNDLSMLLLFCLWLAGSSLNKFSLVGMILGRRFVGDVKSELIVQMDTNSYVKIGNIDF